jgi:hypothetical protein
MEEPGALTALSRRLEDAIAVAEDAVTQIRGFLAEVTQAESERRTTPEAWSIGEIAHHLVLVVRRSAQLPQIVATQPPDRFDYADVLAKRRFDLPDIADADKGGKGVAPDVVRPAAGGDVGKLSDDLGTAWEVAKAEFRPLADRDLSRFYWEHPRLGPLNLYEAIDFQGYHALKHLAQMRRTFARVRA